MSQLPELSFSYNWNNKLNCASFTTIRPASTKYRKNADFIVKLDGKTLGVARCVAVRKFKLHDLPEITAWTDTGYGKEDTVKIITGMYGLDAHMMTFVVACFRWTQEPVEAKRKPIKAYGDK